MGRAAFRGGGGGGGILSPLLNLPPPLQSLGTCIVGIIFGPKMYQN